MQRNPLPSPALGTADGFFTVDGRLANAGCRLRGASLDGLLLGVDIGGSIGRRAKSDLIERAARAGLDSIAVNLDDGPNGTATVPEDCLVSVTMALDAGLVPFVRAFNPRWAWRRSRTTNTTIGNSDGLARRVTEVARVLGSIDRGTVALAIELPVGASPLHEGGVLSHIASARAAGGGHLLIGARAVVRSGTGGCVPDFLWDPVRGRGTIRENQANEASSGTVVAIPVIRTGDGRDLDDPDGELGRALQARQSWFLRPGPPPADQSQSNARIEAFLETIRAARAGGRAPSDNPTVALADQRHVFRLHVDAIRALGFQPADAPGRAPM